MKKVVLILFTLITFFSATCQIEYQSFDPVLELSVYDTLPAYDTLYIDVNNDSINDFLFTMKYWYSFVSPHAHDAFNSIIHPLDSNTIAMNDSFPWHALDLGDGDTIWNNINWELDYGNSKKLLYSDPQIMGDPLQFEDFRYCPFKLYINNYFYFGWFKIRSFLFYNGDWPGSYAKTLISELAYNLEPNNGIIAGDTLTSLYNNSGNEINSVGIVRIYPNPVSDILTIENVENYSLITLHDIVCKIVYKKEILDRVEQIDCSRYKDGLYFISLSNNEEVNSYKVIIAQ